MANGMEALYVGSSGLRSAQNAINTSANNLANVNTAGYVRQQVLFADKNYNTFAYAAVSTQKVGLGVGIGDIVHARDIFLDKSYRSEAGRQAYYSAYYNAIDEVQSLYQELEGTAFKDVLMGSGNDRDTNSSLWSAFEMLAQDPSDATNQSLVIQRSNLLLTRANAIYSSLSTYQSQINIQISNDIDRVNELGKQIYKLNLQIQSVEANHVETAYDLRDARDTALDELGALVNMSYTEDSTGIVTVKLEGQCFIDEAHLYEVGKQVDRASGYVNAYWPYLSNEANGQYTNLFDFSIPISSENNTDIGEIKALIQARGDGVKNFAYLEGANPVDYANSVGMSVMEESEAQLDVLIHGLATQINEVFAPNTRASFQVRTENPDGTYTITQYKNVKVLDADNCRLGSDLKIPPRELFTRVGVDRYTEVTDVNGKTWYIYNEEDTFDCRTVTLAGRDYQIWDESKGNGFVTRIDYMTDENGKEVQLRSEEEPYEQWTTKDNQKYIKTFISGKNYYVLNPDYALDTSSQYTLVSLGVNDELESQVDLFPHLTKDTHEIDYAMGAQISDLWSTKTLKIYPGSAATFSFSEYYTEMIGGIASAGSTYESTATTLDSSVSAIDNKRQQVTGVSADEELTNMIKYQNAYNAASRYIQTVSDMIELLVTGL
ncbi:MAG: flagellar hook-associated protein FlgK [Lachnospiraceae bacterium]|nr:flagellar hook-associated protein FlgK [Lachnospiraceae bacterium]MDD7177408.1 flagellar hook-associated protein FlgK [bacterium]MDY5516636.1 flagellar hook-associated protein FlgK [Lachnospiraceae bacterium]